jgi:hypothetical protein
MKPSFALNITEDSIALLHRTARGWLEVGQTPFDTPDLAEAMAFLRRSAVGLSPRGIATKLVIPNSQILYTEVTAPGPDAKTRRGQIKKALAGRTPYEVDDLVFDWWGNGPIVTVAVVARETLAEAEAFAAEHRLNPLSFVAIPEKGQFGKEPWFGPTEFAASLLAEGEKVERDQDPVVIVARDSVKPSDPSDAEAEAPAEPERVSQPEPAPLPDASSVPDVEPLPEPELLPEPAAEPAPVVEAEPVAEAPAEVVPEPVPPPVIEAAPEPKPVPPAPRTPEPAAEPVAAAPVAPKVSAPVAEAVPAPAEPEPAPATLVIAPAPPPPAPKAPLVADKPPAAVAAKLADVPVKPSVSVIDDVPDAPYVEVPDLGPDLPPATPPFASRRASDLPSGAPALGAAPAPGMAPPKSAKPAAAKTAAEPPIARPRPPAAAAASVAAPAVAPRAPLASGKPGSVTAPGIAGTKARKPKTPPPAARPAAPAPASGAQTMGGFGARQLPQRGKPRYLGLILTAALLLFLALVAAWSSLYLARGDGDAEPVEVASAALPEGEAMPTADVPDIEDEMLADMQDPEDFAAGPEGEPPAEAATEALPSDTLAETATPPLAATPPVATVAGVAANPQPDAQDEIFLAAMDAPQPTLDAFALPQPAAEPDPAPLAQLPPPPFGTFYEFDADGSIRPTAEGIITPDGVTLVAGRPSKVPPAKPAALLEAAAPLATVAAPAAPEADAQPEPFPSDPKLAGAKPRLRPENLVPPAQTDDGAALPDAPDSRLTSLRPRLRPADAVAAIETARATDAATIQLASAPAPRPEELAADVAPGSPLAVAVSRKPAARPKDFSKAVESALAAAIVRTPEAKAPPAEAIEPEAEEEPEVVASAAPKIPTRASVAKQATFVNAINLSKTNLIGVYGTSSKRYALVRQPNGKYRKVKVGDKVDGGTVAAITASELRYKKGSKMLTLAMPKG